MAQLLYQLRALVLEMTWLLSNLLLLLVLLPSCLQE
jgi:hypothetical protein